MKFKKFFNRISYAIIPFIIFVIVLLVSYFGNQLLYTRGLTIFKASNYPEIELDSQIPLISWFVYPYFLTFPLGIIAFFYLSYVNKKAFYNLYITLIICFAISGIIYFFAQTVFTKPDFEPKTFTDKIVVWTWGSTNPVNCFPSQHCFMAFAMIIGVATASSKGATGKMNIFFKIFTLIVSILIVCATVFIRQHFFLDIIASFDIMFIIYPIVHVFKWGEKLMASSDKRRQKRLEKKLNKLGDK